MTTNRVGDRLKGLGIMHSNQLSFMTKCFGISILMSSTSAFAAPFVCDGKVYMTNATSSSAPTFLYEINREVTPYTQTNLYTGSAYPSTLNGLGYNPVDNYLYALKRDLNTSTNTTTILRLDTSGATVLANAGGTGANVIFPGLQNGQRQVQAGTFDRDGNYYVAMTDTTSTSNAPLFRIKGVNTNGPVTVTPIPTHADPAPLAGFTSTSSALVGDFAVSPAESTTDSVVIYGMHSRDLTGHYRLYRYVINDANGPNPTASLSYMTTTLSVSGTTGSVFFDSTGTLYVYRNGGEFYRIDHHTGDALAISDGPTVTVSDGAVCAFNAEKVDVVKSTTGPVQIDATTFTVPYTVIIGNTSKTDLLPKIQVSENLLATFNTNSPTVTLQTGPSVTATPTTASCTLNTSFNGTTDYRLLSGNDDLQPGENCTITFTARVQYASVADIPTTPQNNMAYGSARTLAPNPGHTWPSLTGSPTPPPGAIAADPSTNALALPGTAKGDTPSPTSVTLANLPPPVPQDDSAQQLAGLPVMLDVLANDGSGSMLNPATVQIVGTSKPGDPLDVPGQGTWTVNTTTGAITFTPEPGFTGNPTQISYTVNTTTGTTLPPAKVTVTYLAPLVPDATTLPAGTSATLNVLANDGNSGLLDPATVQIAGTSNPGDSLVVTGQGTWTVDPGTGAITFTPEAGFTGNPTPIQYTVATTAGTPIPATTVTVTYYSPLVPDSQSAPAGTTVTLDVLANDGNSGVLDPATVTIEGSGDGKTLAVPGEGTWTVNPTTGAITFTPETGFTGNPTQIKYSVKTKDGTPVPATTVTVTYTTPPPVPALAPDVRTSPAEVPVVVDVLGNDTAPASGFNPSTVKINDAPGDGKSLIVPGEGTWTVDPAGTITFTPEPGFVNSPTPINYTVEGNDGKVYGPTSVTIITEAEARPDVLTAPRGTVTLDILSNDGDASQLEPTSVKLVGAPGDGKTLIVPGEGTWTVDPVSGELTFAPEAGFIGNPTPIQYTVVTTDGSLLAPAEVRVEFTDPNPPVPPAASDDLIIATSGTVVIDILANDGQPGAVDPGSVTLVGAPGNGKTLVVPGEGTWTVEPDGRLRFEPETGFTGDPTPIRYSASTPTGTPIGEATVTVRYQPQTRDDSKLDQPAGPVTLDVLGNDSNPALLDPATVKIVGAPGDGRTLSVPGQGTWTVNPASGAITFTPAAGFTGDPTPVNYTVATTSGVTLPAASVTVTYLNAPPAVPTPHPDSTTAPAGTTVTLDVLGNDGDRALLDPGSVTIVGAPGDGKTLVIPGQGTWSVNPATGAITFTPVTGFTGSPAPIGYTVKTTGGTPLPATTATVTYTTVPRGPVAIPDSASAPVGTTVTLDVLGNDGNGTPLDPRSVVIIGAPGNGKTLVVPGQGTWSVNPATGAITFTPLAGFTGNPAPIRYAVNTTTGTQLAPVSVTVTYTTTPPLPLAMPDSATAPAGTIVTLDVLNNDDNRPALDPASVKIVGAPGDGRSLVVPGQGTWSVNPATGAITFTPLTGFTGNPTPIHYTVATTGGTTLAPTSVTVTYTTVQTPPEPHPDSVTASVGTTVTLDVLGNDGNRAALDPASVKIVGAPGNGKTLVVPGQGTWTVNPVTGAISFAPLTGFKGNPTPIHYVVSTTAGVQLPATSVTVIYTPATGHPAAISDSASAKVGTTVTLDVLGNDGGDLDPTSVKIVGAPGDGKTLIVPGQGTWSVDPTTGAITFTPEAGFTGNPTPIRYTVETDDGELLQATVTVTYVGGGAVTPIPTLGHLGMALLAMLTAAIGMVTRRRRD